jgi:hypothetical protein
MTLLCMSVTTTLLGLTYACRLVHSYRLLKPKMHNMSKHSKNVVASSDVFEIQLSLN